MDSCLLGMSVKSTSHLKKVASAVLREKAIKDHEATDSQAKDHSGSKAAGSHKTLRYTISI